MSFRRRLALGTLASFAALMVCASVAGAAVPSADVGHNLSETLTSWAKVLLIPTAALMALPALFKRDVGHAVVTLVLVVIIGMLAFDAPGITKMISEVGNNVLGK